MAVDSTQATGGRRLFSSFQLRDFRLLWLASLGFSGGMWVQQVAIGWLVLQMNGTALDLGAVQAARMLPSLLFGMVAGVLADRLPRRELLMGIGAVSALYSIVLAWLIAVGGLEFWHIIALTFIFGSCRAFEWPVAQALIYDVVGPAEALRGISLNGTASRLMGVVAGVAGGAVIPTFGPQGSLVLMAAGYALGVVLLLFLHPPTQAPRGVSAPSFGESLRHGYALARSNRRLLGLFVLSCFGEVFAFSHMTLVPLFARDVLHAGPEGLGLLTSARALGSVASSLLLASLAHQRAGVPLLVAHYAIYGAALIGLALSSNLWVSIGLMAAIGLAASSLDLLQQTLMQLSVPDADRGRAVGYWVAALGFGPVGHLEIGLLGTLLGAPLAMAMNGAIVLVVFGVAVVVIRRGRHGKATAASEAPA